MTALAIALSLCALLAWDAWRRWLAVLSAREIDAEALSVLRRDMVDGLHLGSEQQRAGDAVIATRVAALEERVRVVEALARDGKLARTMR